ncbi:hypothetical protein Tco_0606366 [Tanacetum coccineum]
MVVETYDLDVEEVTSDDEEMVKVEVLMAFSGDEKLDDGNFKALKLSKKIRPLEKNSVKKKLSLKMAK